MALVTVLGFISAALTLSGANRDRGAFYLQQYAPTVYSASPQNWAVAQDPRRIMYFGNAEGVLEYDGATWRKIPVDNGRPVLSLAIDEKGTVYVGSENEFGYLRPDDHGVLRFVTLTAEIAKQERNFGYVRRVVNAQGGVWFQTAKNAYLWKPGNSLKVFNEPGTIHQVGGEVWSYSPKTGLARFNGSAFQSVSGSTLRADLPVRSVFSFHGTVVVATDDGLYRLMGSGLQRWTLPIDKLMPQARITTCLPLQNGELALGTVANGMILLDEAGNLDRIVSKEQDLRSAFVRGMFEDRQGGLWLALDRGIARVEIDQPLTSFGEREGLREMVDAIGRFDGTLYAGTAVGLSSMVPSEAGNPPSFRPASGVPETIVVLASGSSGIFAGGARGVFEIENKVARQIAPELTYDIAISSKDPNVVFTAGNSGLVVLQKQHGSWHEVRRVKSNGYEFRSVVEDTDGRLWVTTRSSISRIDWQTDPPSVEHFGANEGVPLGWNSAYKVDGTVVFATSKGLRRFDSSRKTFVPEDRFGRDFADGTRSVSLIRAAPNGDVWISGEGYHGVLHKDAAQRYQWQPNVLGRSGIKELYALYFDPNGDTWASGMDGGLVQYRRTNLAADSDIPVLLRSVEVLKSSRLVFDGETATQRSPAFRHSENSLRFAFASPNYEDESRTEYQVRLNGFENQWSPWATAAQKEYTNLFEKDYSFHVRARGVEGRISSETVFKFHVLPPWYRTWWAFVLYVLLLAGAIVLLSRRRLAILQAQNRRLEEIITERTTEIRKQRDEIQAHEVQTEALLRNILPQQVAEELRETGGVRPTALDEVAVCFTDFVGFTLASEQVSAPDLVQKLHLYFTAFDEVVDRHRLEKLKTIGDAYMFVGGLPEPSASYAVDTVYAALDIIRFVEEMERKDPGGWKVRIGIHCGPAIAGVVGSRKFAFDIWGETVNRASRMESCSAPNRVNVSEETYELIKPFFRCETRGSIETKEGRRFPMYFVIDTIDPDEFAERYEQAFGKRTARREPLQNAAIAR
jgi:class 3 adenylate cyclase